MFQVSGLCCSRGILGAASFVIPDISTILKRTTVGDLGNYWHFGLILKIAIVSYTSQMPQNDVGDDLGLCDMKTQRPRPSPPSISALDGVCVQGVGIWEWCLARVPGREARCDPRF